ncbi:hypothetical protein LPJ59_005769 [Coemansia sp. RSA 2399]|nr:hypothetical protein LPJ59_005769 [Coemansia sp. RSA 2399]
MPYGLVYSWNTTDSTIVMSNLYSHSVVYGSSLCGGSTQALHYYTALWTYLGFAYGVLGSPISIYWEGVLGTWIYKNSNAMNPPGDTSVSGAMIVGGDLYQVEEDMVDDSSASSEVESEPGSESGSEPIPGSESESDPELKSATASDESSQQPTQSSTGRDSGSGLSKGAKVAIGVAVPMGAIIIAIGVVILIHIWKTKQQDKAWDPSAQALDLQEVALEMTVNDQYLIPPPYGREYVTEIIRFSRIEEPTTTIKKG